MGVKRMKFNIEQLGNISDIDISKNSSSTCIINLSDSSKLEKTVKDLKGMGFDMLQSVTGCDYISYIDLTYHFYSTEFSKKLILKTKVYDSINKIQTLSFLYKSAIWLEREVFDLLGIKFENHPDLRRILLPESFKGYPLKKNYVQDDARLRWNE